MQRQPELTRSELIHFFQNEMEKMKRLGVPDLMRKKNVKALNKILDKQIDYSGFRFKSAPRFTMEEVNLKGEDDLLTASLYIWANPFIYGGDIDFFDDCVKFLELLEQEGGEVGNHIAYLCNSFFFLTKRTENQEDGITIEELLGLKDAVESWEPHLSN